jgi:tetratricopeptide (TPR) repeat protein
MGRLEDAIAEYRRALELDPLSLIINRGVGQAFYYARQYDQAIGQLQKTLELDPYFPGTHTFMSVAYLQKSMYTEGIAEAEKNLAIFPDGAYALAGLGYAYAVAGRRTEAQKVLDQLKQLSKQKHVPAGAMDQIYVALGEKDKAFEWLEKAYEERSIALGGEDIRVDPIYDPLRSDPRFADLLRRMNLQP